MSLGPQSDPFLFLGDHPIMDLLNTVARPVEEIVDLWQSDTDVLLWLNRAGFAPGRDLPGYRPGALLSAAKKLRELVRALVKSKKDGKRLDLAPLNAWMAEGRSFVQMHRHKDGSLTLERSYETKTPVQALIPLAEAAAEFLATADFDLVRHCEGEGCVLWFYDRTKSHRRRWCSMEVCGNRHKVAAFRSRQY